MTVDFFPTKIVKNILLILIEWISSGPNQMSVVSHNTHLFRNLDAYTKVVLSEAQAQWFDSV